MPDLDVVIVNYHSSAHAYTCIKSVHEVAAADGISADIVVVNNSDDAAELRDAVARAGGANIIQNDRNLGFGAACNAGSARGAAPIILFLNPDAALLPGCLKACFGVFNAPGKGAVGIVGPELQDASGALIPSCSRLPSAIDLLWRTSGLHVLFPGFDYPYLSPDAHHRSGPVGQVMGAALFIRRDVFTRLGGFDDAFFLYYEDVDLSARAAALGTVSWYENTAHASHIGGGSSSRDGNLATALHIASRMTYAQLHFGRLSRAAVLIAALVMELPLRTLRALIRGRSVAAVLGMFRTVAAFGLFGTPIPVPDADTRSAP